MKYAALAVISAALCAIALTAPRGGETHIIFGDTVIRAETADTEEERKLGLGGRNTLPDGKGMLFIFPEDDFHPFWMKGMNFSIDILWIDSEKTVRHIETGIRPESYPNSFASPVPVRYVLEIPAGAAEKHGVAVGDVLAW